MIYWVQRDEDAKELSDCSEMKMQSYGSFASRQLVYATIWLSGCESKRVFHVAGGDTHHYTTEDST
jgi:hypothetical protein